MTDRQNDRITLATCILSCSYRQESPILLQINVTRMDNLTQRDQKHEFNPIYQNNFDRLCLFEDTFHCIIKLYICTRKQSVIYFTCWPSREKTLKAGRFSSESPDCLGKSNGVDNLWTSTPCVIAYSSSVPVHRRNDAGKLSEPFCSNR